MSLLETNKPSSASPSSLPPAQKTLKLPGLDTGDKPNIPPSILHPYSAPLRHRLRPRACPTLAAPDGTGQKRSNIAAQ